MTARNPQHAPEHGARNSEPPNDQHHESHSEAHTSLRLLCLFFVSFIDSLVRPLFPKVDQWLRGMTVLFYRGYLTAHCRYTESADGSIIGVQVGSQVARHPYK